MEKRQEWRLNLTKKHINDIIIKYEMVSNSVQLKIVDLKFKYNNQWIAT
jgi:hypothetical protein